MLTSLIYALKLVKADYIPTMGTDGEHLYWNPDFLATLTQEEAAAVVYHEVLHCAFRHMLRRKDRDKIKFNIAADYAINPTVNESFKLPKGALIERKYRGLSAEQIYDRLPKPKKKKGKGDKEDEKSKSGGGSGKGKGQSQPQDEKEQKKGDGGGGSQEKDKSKDKNKKGKGGGGGEADKEQDWGDHSLWGKEGEKKKKELEKKRNMMDKATGKNKVPENKKTPKELDEKWKRLFKEAMLDNYGKMSKSIQRMIGNYYHIPVVDWRTIVQSILSVDDSDYAFANPDRRFLGGDFIMPGLESEEQLQDVIFAFDTSASITEDQFKAFHRETLELFDQFNNVKGWVAVCDAELHSFTEIFGQEEFEDIDFQGGGGTAFEPVFEKIESEMLNPKAVFYFSDTYGSFPDEAPDYPVFWLVPSQIGGYRGWGGSPSAPFGQIIEFLIDKGVEL